MIAERYLRFWNAETSEAQLRVAPDVFTDDVTYHAVVGVFEGADALAAFRTELVEHVGPLTFRAVAPADHHHDRARIRWEVVRADGTSFAAGEDVLVLAADGRVSSVTTFLDRAPEGFAHGGAAA